jgi:hypothetical protein
MTSGSDHFWHSLVSRLSVKTEISPISQWMNKLELQ